MLKIEKKEQSAPQNYSTFYYSDPTRREIRVTLCNGKPVYCSRHRAAQKLIPCACMKQAGNEPDKDQYWQPYVNAFDYSELIDE